MLADRKGGTPHAVCSSPSDLKLSGWVGLSDSLLPPRLPLLLSQARNCSPRGGRLWRYSRIVAGMFTRIGRKWELKGCQGSMMGKSGERWGAGKHATPLGGVADDSKRHFGWTTRKLSFIPNFGLSGSQGPILLVSLPRLFREICICPLNGELSACGQFTFAWRLPHPVPEGRS